MQRRLRLDVKHTHNKEVIRAREQWTSPSLSLDVLSRYEALLCYLLPTQDEAGDTDSNHKL